MAKKSNKQECNLDMFYVYREGDNYYIHAEYLENRPDGLHKITFHNVRLPLFDDKPGMSMETSRDLRWIQHSAYVNFGFGDLLLEPCHSTCTDELIKPTVKEMTISDIEKELGYSIKIIKENGK